MTALIMWRIVITVLVIFIGLTARKSMKYHSYNATLWGRHLTKKQVEKLFGEQEEKR